MIRKLLAWPSILVVILLAVGAVVFLWLVPRIPRLPDDLRLLASTPATEIYARGGDLLGTVGGREYVSLDRISPHFRNAILAVEDKRFHHHRGVDHLAIIRALSMNIIRLGDAPGGSTITQQLAKNLFFTFDRSLKRKLMEALAAMAIEDRFTKDEIIESYCNLVYFGQYAYGVERAAQTYFGKHASDLGLHEAALLAGLPNSPARLNPFNNPDRASARQRMVLQQMARAGMIRPEAVDSFASCPVELSGRSNLTRRGSYPVDYALEIAGEAVGSDLVSYGGVRITTTIDPFLQRTAEKVLSSGMEVLQERLQPLRNPGETRLEGALVAIEVASGQVVALVGGRSYAESPYNRAVRALRAPGSAFKPVVYLTALEEADVTPATVLEDRPVSIPIDRHRKWEPVNFDHRYRGPVTLKLGLTQSINTIAAQLIEKVGPERVVRTAQRLGIKSPLEPHLSLALGSQGVTPLEMAAVFATIAREGVALEPQFVRQVEDRGGELLYERLTAGEQRFAAETVYQLIDMMIGVIDGGTGSVVRRLGFKGIAAGKTGTSSDFRDAWFVGGTPFLVTVVWIGYDDNREMRLKSDAGVTGATGAAPIWADFMIRATAGQLVREFPRPTDIECCYVEPNTGLVSRELQPGYIPVALKSEDATRLLAEIGSDKVTE